MSEDASKYLLPEDDGLPMRKSHDYALDKLNTLRHYINMMNVSMGDKRWRERFYIDLQAGPGKNSIGNLIVLGSPLIALTASTPFTQYRFNEKYSEEFEALNKRVKASSLHNRVRISQLDVNTAVYPLCEEIDKINKKFIKGAGSCLNLAFLDPMGLELHWSTVERLAQLNYMDIIITFFTSGIIRNVEEYPEAVDRVYGSQEWRKIGFVGDPIVRRRNLINVYLNQLKDFGYKIRINPDIESHDISIRNSKNAEVYSLIFASKHELGNRFWREAGKSTKPPKLPGF